MVCFKNLVFMAAYGILCECVPQGFHAMTGVFYHPSITVWLAVIVLNWAEHVSYKARHVQQGGKQHVRAQHGMK